MKECQAEKKQDESIGRGEETEMSGNSKNSQNQKNSRKSGADNIQEAQKLYKDLRKRKVPMALAALICAAVVGFGVWSGTQPGGRDGRQATNLETQQKAGESEKQAAQQQEPDKNETQEAQYGFRTKAQLEDHFERHGVEMGFEDEEAYVAGANRVIASPDALHKLEAEDGDDVYYLEDTNEFVVLSKDGYIRTYFEPDDGLAYYERQ